jgi:hypothetical protein
VDLSSRKWWEVEKKYTTRGSVVCATHRASQGNRSEQQKMAEEEGRGVHVASM